ncbi:MAG: hypothetical protein L0Y56_09560 [Nitrospira sp.]|nr:hypothetical protein [Nitrospira sp.]
MLSFPRQNGLKIKILLSLVGLVAGLGWFPLTLYAATPLDAVAYSPDISVVLGGTLVSGQDVAEDNLAGTVLLINIGSLPAGTHVIAYHFLPTGEQLLALDTPVSLPGGLTALPGDVVSFNGTTYTQVFNAAAHNLPAGVMVDAVSVFNGGDLLLSLDTTVVLSGGVIADDDLVRFNGSTFTLFFDGSAAGVAAGLDLDGAHYQNGNGHLLLSFDGSGIVGGVPFDDEDILEYTPGSNTWELVYDGSAHHAGWSAADLDAVNAFLVSDLDGDEDIDQGDLNILLAARNTPASGPDDPRDLNRDGVTNALDARILVTMCTRPRCATQ